MLKKYKPGCSCFNGDDDMLIDRLKSSVKISHALGQMFIEMAASWTFCRQALPFIMEDVLINIATRIVAENMTSEIASEGARVETLALFVDLEKRLTEKVNEIYACARGMEEEERQEAAAIWSRPRNGETLQ
jgi:hypothetical protein